ncbi:hypothetical protein [Brumimicrobium oceani]|uniref:ATP-grasp domain-containing protein n=1 Tax=Brumimicrobium oceani TaxID=2100725 RepID=A0A2U2XF87_9FLAO|nr:hypothetical protein [Brumimicrobium oceani]PWH86417.1 hypothetical protein DIT68_04035 [Brumimicrobium oceani]
MTNAIQIIGGAKTGYNLYKFLLKEGISSTLYYFPNEYSEKKRIGEAFIINKNQISDSNNILVSSETAFNHLSELYIPYLSNHYYLRDKANISKIANDIKTNYIPEINVNNLLFPLAVKPKDSMKGNVSFKFKKIETKIEFDELGSIVKECLLQPYLDEKEYRQVAIAGYYNGYENSLIAVEQKNHYPKGISAYVVNKTAENKELIFRIEEHLSDIDYKGFIEFEFKQKLDTKEYFLMDINPRTWGWFYYYLDSVQNFKEVFLENKPVQLSTKQAWVNTPRLGMAFLKHKNLSCPKISDILKNKICYEPYFK